MVRASDEELLEMRDAVVGEQKRRAEMWLRVWLASFESGWADRYMGPCWCVPPAWQTTRLHSCTMTCIGGPRG